VFAELFLIYSYLYTIIIIIIIISTLGTYNPEGD